MNEPNKLKRNIRTTKNKNLTSLDVFINQKVGGVGTDEREQVENEYEAFKIGVLIQQAREERDLTQEKLAQSTGESK